MIDELETSDYYKSMICEIDEYDPVETYENQLDCWSGDALSHTTPGLNYVSNDDFMAAIFGRVFKSARPLICRKSGDPDKGGWIPLIWPCITDLPDQNWYTLPSLYKSDEHGKYRAKKELAVSVHAVMVDDIGTKVDPDRFTNCPPSWAIETSPGNFQYGYILANPITDLDIADKLKARLIAAGLCDSGATGGAARWMRLPKAINGRPKYGTPSPDCRLATWHPQLKYTVESLYTQLELDRNQSAFPNKDTSAKTSAINRALRQQDGTFNSIIETLKTAGLYKKSLGSGKHDITCPWLHGHTDSIDNGTAYFEPSDEYPSGGFKCHHSHGHLFSIRDLKEYLGIDTEPPGSVEHELPSQLPPALLPVPSLVPSNLPESVAGAVTDLADRLQCPPDYLAVSMLSAAGAVIGNKVGIFPYANDESWEVYPALWGGIVGEPGSKKSPALQQAHLPLQQLESMAAQIFAKGMADYENSQAQYEKDLKSWNAEKKSGLKPAPPIHPKRERYVVHDSTYQALGVILADNPRGILALADELSGLLQSLDTPGQEAARGFYLTGWSGTGGYSFDRVGRGSITLDRYCLSVFGGFQPDRIKAYVQFSQRGSSKNDGLLQRFQLLVWPDPIKAFRLIDRKPNKLVMDRYHEAILNLPKLGQRSLAGAKRVQSGAQLFHFTPKAQQTFNAWYVQNERILSNDDLDTARQSHFAKYRSLIPALALLFHLLDRHEGSVCDECLNRALAFADYLKEHANRIYASVSGHDYNAIRTLATRLLNSQLSNEFTGRTLTLKGWAGLATREQAQAAIDALVEYNWLTETELRTGGRPSIKYTLNPYASSDLL